MTTLSTEQADAVAALHRRDLRDRRLRVSRWHNRIVYLASLAVTASAWAALFFLGRYLLAAIARGLR